MFPPFDYPLNSTPRFVRRTHFCSKNTLLFRFATDLHSVLQRSAFRFAVRLPGAFLRATRERRGAAMQSSLIKTFRRCAASVSAQFDQQKNRGCAPRAALQFYKKKPALCGQKKQLRTRTIKEPKFKTRLSGLCAERRGGVWIGNAA